jgi:spectinomycin phosphotransferase
MREDLPPDAGESLLRALRHGFGADVPRLEFVPVGADSWCYRAGRFWVTARRDLLGHHPLAYDTATVLGEEYGLDFVLPPLRWPDGSVVRRVGRYPVLVFPYVPATQVRPPLSRAAGEAVADLLHRLHRSAAKLPAALGEETYRPPFLEAMDWTLDTVARGPAPDVGPYSRRVFDLVRAHRPYLLALRRELHELAADCRADGTPFVPTHGEPGGGNVLVDADRYWLVDWGQLRWGPPERDLFHLRRSFNIDAPGRQQFMRFYEVRWFLSEFAEYGSHLLRPHVGGGDYDVMWAELVDYLAAGCAPGSLLHQAG